MKEGTTVATERTRVGAAFADPHAEEACDVLHLDAVKVRALRGGLINPTVAGALADTFKVLGDLTRVRILDALSREELCVCDIAALLGSSESAVSHQLRLLRSMRIVRARRSGRMVFYALDDQHIRELVTQGLRHVEEGRNSGEAAGLANERVRR